MSKVTEAGQRSKSWLKIGWPLNFVLPICITQPMSQCFTAPRVNNCSTFYSKTLTAHLFTPQIKSVTIKLEVNMLRNKYERDELEQYTRRDSIRIFGVAEDLVENLVDKAMKIAADIDVNISQSDVSTIHRIWKFYPANAQNKPRPIICRFVITTWWRTERN